MIVERLKYHFSILQDAIYPNQYQAFYYFTPFNFSPTLAGLGVGGGRGVQPRAGGN